MNRKDHGAASASEAQHSRKTARFPPKKQEDVFGVLRYTGPAKTVEEMDEGVAAEARRRAERWRAD